MCENTHAGLDDERRRREALEEVERREVARPTSHHTVRDFAILVGFRESVAETASVEDDL